MNNSNFFFHESFAPQTIYLSEILKLASENYCGNKFEISNLTGIPTGETSGKVEPHIRYLSYMGLIEYECNIGKYSLRLTELGNVVFREDKYLMHDITKLLMHYNLTRRIKGAPQWSFLFREYPYDFNTNILFNKINENGKILYGKEIYLGPIKTVYSGGDFTDISPIEFDGKDIIFKSMYMNYECNNLYAYTLLKDIEENNLNNCEIILDKILEDIKWQKGFGFDYNTTIEVLDELSYMGIIKLNKQLNPMTIIVNKKSSDVLNELYDNLI